MLTGPFKMTPAPVLPPAPDETLKPGDPAFLVTPEILLDFAHCPARLQARGKAPEPNLTNHAELARHYHLDPGSVVAKFARRPDSYPTFALTCPRCNSVSAAQVCRRCNTSRVNQPVTKPWSSSAPECRKWKAQQEDLGRIVITTAQDLAAKQAVARLAADPEIVEFTGPKPSPTLLTGFWQDVATGRKLPLAVTVDYLPGENSTYGAAIGFLLFTTDGALGGWTRSAYYSGLHVRAALALDLFNAGADIPRTHVLCVLSETKEPFEPARRLLTPKILQVGRNRYSNLLASYAQAAQQDLWPSYDPAGEFLQAWSLFDVEPWMAERPDPFGVPSAPAQPRQPAPAAA
jgi:hypothetical protein